MQSLKTPEIIFTENHKKYLQEFIEANCIFRCPPGYVIPGLPEGHVYSWQFYLRKAIYDPSALHCITSWLLSNYNQDYQYAAMETAGPPMLSALKTYGFLIGLNIEGFGIRKDQKKYGLKNWIEGIVNDYKEIIIIDDIANSKSTIRRAKDIIEAHDLKAVSALTIVNKKDNDGIEIEGLEFPVKSIFKISDFKLTWQEYYGDKTLSNEELEQWIKWYGLIKR